MYIIGYMGIEGSFSDIAAEKLVAETGIRDAKCIPMTSAKNILQALQNGEITHGVLAVRNSSVGPVSEFVNTFQNVHYDIIGEYILPIHHCIFRKNPKIAKSSLTVMASHPQALAQTRDYRKVHFPELTEQVIDDTALAAKWLASGQLPENTAVICSEKCGPLFGLDLIAHNIEDASDNTTIFWLLTLSDEK
ncbi:MAG: hypothetical protein LUF92_04770 [Clostridiales bacterium]|nr:hypothetical protein [Clostridiales bacterium]